jgi:hypothetical protein
MGRRWRLNKRWRTLDNFIKEVPKVEVESDGLQGNDDRISKRNDYIFYNGVLSHIVVSNSRNEQS